MARKCVRCGARMNENGSLCSADGSRLQTAYVKKEGKKLRTNLGPIQVAICPVCGEISLYILNPEDLNS